MPDPVVRDFPLFPLGLVALPHELVPLHIFEERYKTMIGECLESGEEFGIVWLSDDRLHEVGCTARITQVLDEFDDGRMNILVTGSRPFRMSRRVGDLPYPAGDVEMLDLTTEAEPGRVTDERPESDALEELDAFGMAATIELEAAAKQRLLELESENERLRMVADLFRTTVTR